MSLHKTSRKQHLVLRNEQFDLYLKKAWEESAPHEKLKIQSALGKIRKIESQVAEYSLDKKLLIMTYLNKQFCLLIWDKDAGASFYDFQKTFNFYISAKENYLAEEARRRLNMFCIDTRQAAKHYFAGTYRYSEPVYRTAENGDVKKYMSNFKTPNVSLSQTERTERNFDVYKLFCKLLTKGYYLDNYLLPYKIDYGHFKILMALFVADKPLTKEKVLEKDNLNYDTRTSPSVPRLNHLINILGCVDEHKFADKIDEEETTTKKVLYTLSAKGIDLYLEIINAITKDDKN